MRCIAADKKHLSQYYSKTVVDYLNQEPAIRGFYQYGHDSEGYKQKIQDRSLSEQHRNTLVKVLQEQYKGLLVDGSLVANNIAALANQNTYTVTTGQQIHIYLGPLYVVNKILSTIAKCRELAKQYPDKTFVPVFWMASEDHDFEEINHIKLFYKDFVWNGEEGFEGAVGRLAPAGINNLKDTIAEVLRDDQEAHKLLNLFTEAYTKYTTLADATRYVLNTLFQQQGLVVLDADNTQLKQALKPYIEKDIFGSENINAAQKTTAQLEENYKAQIHPREINFFYLTPKGRYRIAKEGETYKALGSTLEFTAAELSAEIETHPENFSPNVVLRPLYQEVILPNIAYIGGPAEVNYWLQLKGVFDINQVPLPIIELRKSLIQLNEKTLQNIEDMGLDITTFLAEERKIGNEFVEENGANIPDYSAHYKAIENEFELLKNKALEVDANLKPFLEGELKKITDTFGKLDNKLQKFEKQKFDNQLKKIETIKSKFFTPGKLAERVDTVLSEPQICNQQIIEDLLVTFNQQKSPLIIVFPPLK